MKLIRNDCPSIDKLSDSELFNHVIGDSVKMSNFIATNLALYSLWKKRNLIIYSGHNNDRVSETSTVKLSKSPGVYTSHARHRPSALI